MMNAEFRVRGPHVSKGGSSDINFTRPSITQA